MQFLKVYSISCIKIIIGMGQGGLCAIHANLQKKQGSRSVIPDLCWDNFISYVSCIMAND